MAKQQVLIRMEDSLYTELLNGARACRMSIQQYMIFLLGDATNRIKGIEREVGKARDDIHTIMINNRLSFSYLKEMQKALFRLCYCMGKDTIVNLSEETKKEALKVIADVEQNSIKKASNNDDIYNIETFLKLAEESGLLVDDDDENTDENDDEKGSENTEDFD